eukprot:m.183940 g.183940  ORF g.183940 m.183940 type:complete len:64 (-) comp18089_c0_seq6:684-875(-)
MLVTLILTHAEPAAMEGVEDISADAPAAADAAETEEPKVVKFKSRSQLRRKQKYERKKKRGKW